MKPRAVSPVRALALRHAAGEISRRDYIRARRALLDDIAAGQVALPDEDIPPSPPPRRALNEALAADDTLEFTLPAGLNRRRLHLLLIAALLAAAAGAAWLWWTGA